MKIYQLAVGLVLRRGDRTMRFVRKLARPEPTFAFEDEVDGEPKVLTLAALDRGIRNKELEVVSGEDADLRSPREERLELTVSLAELPDRYQKDTDRRLAYIQHMQRLGITKGARRRIREALSKLQGRMPGTPPDQSKLDPKPPKDSTVMDWMSKLARAGGNVIAVVSRNARRKVGPRLSEAVLDVCRDFIDKFYLTRSKPSLVATKDEILKDLRQKASAKEIDATAIKVSETTLRRLLKEVDPYIVVKRREGAARANHEFRYSLNGARARYPLQRYEIDHTILDIVVVCPLSGMPLGRPTITVVIDAYSSYIAGFFISFWGTGLASTLAALKMAIAPKDDFVRDMDLTQRWLAYGIPSLFVVDNGLEFHSQDFLRAAMLLNASVQYCAVRSPWLKPFVERAMREVNAFLPAEGKVHKPKNNYLPPSPEKTAALALTSLTVGLTKAFVDVHPLRTNRRLLARPLDLFQEGMDLVLPPLLPSSTDELDLIAAVSDIRNVTHDGIQIEYLMYRSTKLAALRRATGSDFKTRVKFNPEDLGSIFVQDPISKGWLLVPCAFEQYAIGLSLVQHKAIRTACKSVLKARNAEEVLMLEKEKLQQLWRDAIHLDKRKKVPKELLKTIYGSVTSTRNHLALDPASRPTPKPEMLVGSDASRSVEVPDDEELEAILY